MQMLFCEGKGEFNLGLMFLSPIPRTERKDREEIELIKQLEAMAVASIPLPASPNLL